MSEKIIKEMIADIKSHRGRDKQALLEFYVTERINRQVQSYYNQILNSYSILTHQKNELSVVKKLTK